MKAPPHLPLPSSTCAARFRFPFHPSLPFPEEVSRFLQALRVRSVTAIEYRCFRPWEMKPRRIGDDMFFFVISGQGEILVENRRSHIGPGDSAHFRRGVLHGAAHDPRRPFRVMALHYTATFFESLTLPDLFQFPDVFHFGMQNPLLKMMQEACREYALQPPGWERGLEALMVRILLHLIYHHSTLLHLNFKSARFAELQRILPCLETMRNHLDDAEGIPALARRCGFSEAQFRRVFHRVMGISPVQHLRRVRIEEACRLFRQTDETVESIASRVGYEEPAFFAHTFRRMMGVSPGKYRRIGL